MHNFTIVKLCKGLAKFGTVVDDEFVEGLFVDTIRFEFDELLMKIRYDFVDEFVGDVWVLEVGKNVRNSSEV